MRPDAGTSAGDNGFVRILAAAAAGRGAGFALTEFVLAVTIALFHYMRKQSPIGFIWYSIGFGGKPLAKGGRRQKRRRKKRTWHGPASRHEAAGRMR
jgi:hypothetical protein